MFNKLQTNLAFKAALYSVLTAAALGFLISTYEVWSNLEQRKQHERVFINSLIATTLPSISLATYNFNNQQKQQLIDGLTSHPSILNASIFDTKGGEIGVTTAPDSCNPSNIRSLFLGTNYQFEYPMNHLGTYLGKLILELNPCQQSQQLLADIKHTVISGLIYSIGIALIIYFLFYRLVSLPISLLAKKLQELDPSAIELSSIQHINSPRKDEIGVLVNSFATLLRTTHDHISRLKSAEHTINDYSSNLEALVNKRTEAISGINNELKSVNNKSKRAQRNAEQFNQSQMRLLKNLSHELRLPLSNTVQTLKQLQDSRNTAAQHSLLESSISQNKKIIFLLNELDVISQLKHSLNPLKVSPFSIQTLMEKLSKQVTQNPQLPFQIDLTYESALAPSHIGNREEIQQLIFNLVANILNNTPRQRINISISENTHCVLFNFSAPELKLADSLFEQMVLPFANIFSSNPLTSMGLAYARDLTEFLDGNIHVNVNSQNENELSLQLPLLSSSQALESLRSQLPSGGIRISSSQVALTDKIEEILNAWNLPFILSDIPTHDPVLLITDNAEHPEHKDIGFIIGIGDQFTNKNKLKDIHLQGLKNLNDSGLYHAIIQGCGHIQADQTPKRIAKILLVEDNIINRMLSQRFLRNLNTEIEMVENGKEAVNITNRKHYDLIFMDCQMPIMDGFEATRQIRRSQLNKKTPIIALTGLESDDERHACLQSGMNDFISKPFSQEQLQAAIRQWLPNIKNES
jgi:CheY-like chemotaxis protein